MRLGHDLNNNHPHVMTKKEKIHSHVEFDGRGRTLSRMMGQSCALTNAMYNLGVDI